MKMSPFILSAILHVLVVSALWCQTAKHEPPPRILYVDLSEVPLAATRDAAEPPQAQTPQQFPDEDEPEPEPEDFEDEETAVAQGDPSTLPRDNQQPAVASEISRAFAGALYAQEMMYNTRRYYEVAGMAVREVLEGKLGGGKERLNGKTLRILASYEGGGKPEYSVKTESEELRVLLQDGAAWERIPTPQQCKLQYKKVAFLVSMQRGSIQVGLAPQ